MCVYEFDISFEEMLAFGAKWCMQNDGRSINNGESVAQTGDFHQELQAQENNFPAALSQPVGHTRLYLKVILFFIFLILKLKTPTQIKLSFLLVDFSTIYTSG